MKKITIMTGIIIVVALLAACTTSTKETAVTQSILTPTVVQTTIVAQTAVPATVTPIPTTTASPTATTTISPTPESTYTSTPGPLWSTTPVASQYDDFQAAIFPDEMQTELILRITQGDQFQQELLLTQLDFEDSDLLLPVQIIGAEEPILVDYEQDGTPEIILTFYLPGASCCGVVTVLYFDPEIEQFRNSNVLVNKYTLTPTIVDIDEDGLFEFMRRIENFHYALDGATSTTSISPLQIMTYANGKIVDITSQHLNIIADDAELWLEESLTHSCQVWPWGVYLAEMAILEREEEGWHNYSEACGTDSYFERRSENIREVLNEFGYTN